MGWENIFHVENNEFCKKILKHYWPDAISYTDITTTDFTKHVGAIDILTGGFPCQPFSTAGKRKGKEDNRYLWPEMLRAIREIQPSWIVAENVYGIINQGRGLVFEQVQVEMENAGYQVQSYLLPACAVNAPHRRDRFWFVAYSQSNSRFNGTGNEGHESQEIQEKRFNECVAAANSISIQLDKEREERQQCGNGWQPCSIINGNGTQGIITNTNNKGLQAFWEQNRIRKEKRQALPGIERRSLLGGKRSWEGWPTQSPIRGRDDGLSGKLAKQCLEGFGNAIVPQVAYEIFKAIETYEQHEQIATHILG